MNKLPLKPDESVPMSDPKPTLDYRTRAFHGIIDPGQSNYANNADLTCLGDSQRFFNLLSNVKPIGDSAMFKKTLFLALTFLVSGQVFAATVNVYTERTAWEADLAGFTLNTETFSNPITAADAITLDNGIVSTASPSGLGSSANSVSSGQYYAYTCSIVSCAFPTEYDWALPSATYAIGGDFSGLAPQGAKIDIDALGFVGTAINDSVGGPPYNGFYGIISDTLFDNIDFRCYLDCGDGFRIDNFSIASSPPPIPVPAAVWLFATALVGLAGFSRRRKTG